METFLRGKDVFTLLLTNFGESLNATGHGSSPQSGVMRLVSPLAPTGSLELLLMIYAHMDSLLFSKFLMLQAKAVNYDLFIIIKTEFIFCLFRI